MGEGTGYREAAAELLTQRRGDEERFESLAIRLGVAASGGDGIKGLARIPYQTKQEKTHHQRPFTLRARIPVIDHCTFEICADCWH